MKIIWIILVIVLLVIGGIFIYSIKQKQIENQKNKIHLESDIYLPEVEIDNWIEENQDSLDYLDDCIKKSNVDFGNTGNEAIECILNGGNEEYCMRDYNKKLNQLKC